MHKVSIIIPVYNVEAFLPKCLDSVINQDYPNIEIIIVNDGSTDSSLDICRLYDNNFENVRLINQLNKGVSVARNIGIQNATGDYCCFIDSDDYVETNYVSTMVEFISQADIDLVCCGCYRENNNGGVLWTRRCINHTLLSNQDAMINLYSSAGFCGWPWNKMFKLSIINDNNIRFPEDIKYCEDEVFCMNYILHVRKVYYIPDLLYHYMINEDSVNLSMIKNKEFNYRCLDRLKADDIMEKVVSEKYPKKVVNILKARVFESTTMTVNKLLACFNNDKKTLNMLQLKLIKYLPYYLMSKYHKKTIRAIFSNILLCICPLCKLNKIT